MAKLGLLLFAVYLTVPYSNCEDELPLLDLASSFLQNMGNNGGNGDGLAAIGNIVGSLMQGDNAKNLGSLLGQGNGGNGADILSGLGSLLGNQNGQLDPSLVGSMISMFAQQTANSNEEKPQQRQKRSNENELNLDGILNMASSFLENKNTAGLMPVIMNVVNSMSGSEVKKRAKEHEDHASFLPPYLEKAHLYWDLFINSELGKTMWQKSGLSKALKSFTGPDGKLSFELMMKNFENHSFRRHWIKAAARYLTDTVVHIAKPEVYQRYIVSAQYLINGFLDSQGLPESTHFNIKRPEHSITVLINHVLKQYLLLDTDVSGYVKPAIEYTKQTLKMAQSVSQSIASRGDYNALADRLTDTLNMEVIEPVLRVYRAYRHSVEAPQCQEHLMCLVNRHHDADKQGLPGFKAGLTKLSSMIASAALSFQNGKGFWDLYNAIQNDVNCEAKYPADCAAFHEHELKVTTEVYHSEL